MPRAIKNRPEEDLHRATVQYLAASMPLASFWFTVPNQRGTRKKYEMGILKALGVKAGVPDIVAIYEGRFIGIELKAPKGKISENQERASDAIVMAGGLYTVARSVEEVEHYLRAIGLPMRGRVV